ncbi:MAG: sulfurtransferase TusA family protein [Candidatus Krumholzibacteriales bacterium]
MIRKEEKLIARGLNPPGPLLMLKKKLKEIEYSGNLRIIVSNIDAADEIITYFREISADYELDRVGDDYHLIMNLDSYEEV